MKIRSIKRNLITAFFAVALVIALVFIVAPSAKANTGTNTVQYMTLDAQPEETINITKNTILDLAGFDATVNVADGINLSVIDSANMEMDGSTAGKLTVTGTGTIAHISRDANYRYLKVENVDGTFSFHPFNLAFTRIGINTLAGENDDQIEACVQIIFIANNIVRDNYLGDYGICSVATGLETPANVKYPFGTKNGIRAYVDFTDSLKKENIDKTANYKAYMYVDGEKVESAYTLEVTPREILKKVNASYTAATPSQLERINAMVSNNDRVANILTNITGNPCVHHGGTATCVAAAKCIDCDASYGTVVGHKYETSGYVCDFGCGTLKEKLAFDFENAIDLNYVSIGPNCGSANFAIVDAASEGMPAEYNGVQLGNVLKMYGQDGTYPQAKISFGQTLPAGTEIEVVIGFNNPQNYTGGWFGLIVNGHWHESELAWWFGGGGVHWGHFTITLTEAADSITVGANYGHGQSGITDTSAMAAYFGNIVAKTPKASFDWENPTDITYVSGTANFAIVDAASEGMPAEYNGVELGNVLKMYGQTTTYPQATISFGQTLPAGSQIEVVIGFNNPQNYTGGWFGLIVNGHWHESELAWWFGGGGVHWGHFTITLTEAASSITVGANYGHGQSGITDTSAMVAYFGNIVAKTPKASFDWENPTDINYVGIGPNCGSANFAIVDAASEGMPAEYNGVELGNVLKMYGQDGTSPQAKISFGQTLPAGTEIEVVIGFNNPQNYTGGWFGLIVNGHWHESELAWWFGGGGVHWGHFTITLTEAADSITVGANYGHGQSGITDTSAMVAYFGSVTVMSK